MSRRQNVKLMAITVLVLFASACHKPPPQSNALPFEWTNIVHDASAFNKVPSTGTIVNFTNHGTWSSHYPDRINMAIGSADYEATVFFNPTNNRVTRIVQQTTVGTNRYWLIDQDGDGLPDQRRKFGNPGRDRELLIRGEWIQARGPASEPEVYSEGNWIPVHFTNGVWRPQSQMNELLRTFYPE